MSPAVNQEPIRWFSRTVSRPPSLAALRTWVAAQPGGVMLESLAADRRWSRHSIYAVRPLRTVRVDADNPRDPFDLLARHCRPWRQLSPEPQGPRVQGVEGPSRLITGATTPFVGGWIGYLAYEAGRFVEPTARWRLESHGLPLAHWSLYDTVLIHDRVADEWTVAGCDFEGGVGRSLARQRIDDLAELLELVRAPRSDAGKVKSDCGALWRDGRNEYEAKVRRVLDYIRAGDVFQVNVARCFHTTTRAEPLEIYQRLCQTNPAAYAAYLSMSEAAARSAVLSSSPELFLDVRQGEVITRPIKGTRPRTSDDVLNRAARADLSSHPKDAAELNMIIDLERNDLGRVCEYGSVKVVNDGCIEALPTVFHRTATIRGRLREDRDALDVLRAAFPGGSITGAPKVRAMQIIHELEDFPRGPYCGAVGYIGLDGRMGLNLAIRTLSMHEGVIDLCVGSGIVADSDPSEEYAELEAKAAGMLAALGAGDPVSPTEYLFASNHV